MKILLLGAAGFIGTNLTIELAKKTEDEITLVDRSKAFFKPIVSIFGERKSGSCDKNCVLCTGCGKSGNAGKAVYHGALHGH